MTKSKRSKDEDVELRSDGWKRFERVVDVVDKSAPKHRPALSPKQKERPASKGRVHKGRTRS